MTANSFIIGAYVFGSPASPRALVPHAEVLTAYADGTIEDDREAYLSHFSFGPEMRTHYAANRYSVAGYEGPCWCRWLVLDIDRADLGEALADARRLVGAIHQRYPESEGDVPIYFSGGKGFHVLIELAHGPPPAVGFHTTARAFAELLSARAEVRIDNSVFDIAHIIRLPNTRHPRTGLFKRRIEPDTLFKLEIPGILEIARHPAGDGIPILRQSPPQLAADWQEAEREAARKAEARAVVRHDVGPADSRAPRYFLDFLRFGVGTGDRHQTLFRCAAWLTEQKAPPSLVFAVLTEPGRDVGLAPKDVDRQIRCGIDHARRQQGTAVDPPPDPNVDPDGFERWAIQHEGDDLPSGILDFHFGEDSSVKGPA